MSVEQQEGEGANMLGGQDFFFLLHNAALLVPCDLLDRVDLRITENIYKTLWTLTKCYRDANGSAHSL